MSRHDRRASIQSNHSDNGTTAFPDFDTTVGREHDTIYEDQTLKRVDSKHPSASPARRPNGILHSEKWAPTREYTPTRGNGQINGIPIGRNRQKSLGEAIRTIHARKASVSANAHELAEALKAPVSYKLVVRSIPCYHSLYLTSLPDSVLDMVFQLSTYKHLLEINSHHLQATSHFDNHTILLRFLLVSILCSAGSAFSGTQKRNSSFEEWYQTTNEGCDQDDSTFGLVPSRRTYPLLPGYGYDTGFLGPYHQRTIPAVHRGRLQIGIQRTLYHVNLSIPNTFDHRSRSRL